MQRQPTFFKPDELSEFINAVKIADYATVLHLVKKHTAEIILKKPSRTEKSALQIAFYNCDTYMWRYFDYAVSLTRDKNLIEEFEKQLIENVDTLSIDDLLKSYKEYMNHTPAAIAEDADNLVYVREQLKGDLLSKSECNNKLAFVKSVKSKVMNQKENYIKYGQALGAAQARFIQAGGAHIFREFCDPYRFWDTNAKFDADSKTEGRVSLDGMDYRTVVRHLQNKHILFRGENSQQACYRPVSAKEDDHSYDGKIRIDHRILSKLFAIRKQDHDGRIIKELYFKVPIKRENDSLEDRVESSNNRGTP